MTLADQMADFNNRLKSILETEALDTEGKNFAIGLLVTLRAPMLRDVAAALRARPSTEARKQ